MVEKSFARSAKLWMVIKLGKLPSVFTRTVDRHVLRETMVTLELAGC